jgi:hypothetical protein
MHRVRFVEFADAFPKQSCDYAQCNLGDAECQRIARDSKNRTIRYGLSQGRARSLVIASQYNGGQALLMLAQTLGHSGRLITIAF